MGKGIRRRASRGTKLKPNSFEEKDPLLALRDLGKELWRDLGGGEKFIHELRSNWYGKGQKASLLRQKSRPGWAWIPDDSARFTPKLIAVALVWYSSVRLTPPISWQSPASRIRSNNAASG